MIIKPIETPKLICIYLTNSRQISRLFVKTNNLSFDLYWFHHSCIFGCFKHATTFSSVGSIAYCAPVCNVSASFQEYIPHQRYHVEIPKGPQSTTRNKQPNTNTPNMRQPETRCKKKYKCITNLTINSQRYQSTIIFGCPGDQNIQYYYGSIKYCCRIVGVVWFHISWWVLDRSSVYLSFGNSEWRESCHFVAHMLSNLIHKCVICWIYFLDRLVIFDQNNQNIFTHHIIFTTMLEIVISLLSLIPLMERFKRELSSCQFFTLLFPGCPPIELNQLCVFF